MEDQNIQTGQEAHCQFYDSIENQRESKTQESIINVTR